MKKRLIKLSEVMVKVADTNSNGCLEEEELINQISGNLATYVGFDRNGDKNLTGDEITEELSSWADLDHDGSIPFVEYMSAVLLLQNAVSLTDMLQSIRKF